MAGRRTFRILTSSLQSCIWSKKQQYTHSTTNTHKMTTIHTRQLQYTKTTTTINTRQLQQYIQDNYNNTHKTTTTIHTRKLQQYTQDNYNNTHKTTTTIHTRQLQQYTQANYNNTHKATTIIHTKTTIHTRQPQQYTQDNYNNTHKKTNSNTCTTCWKGEQHEGNKVLYIVCSIFPRNSISWMHSPFPSKKYYNPLLLLCPLCPT